MQASVERRLRHWHYGRCPTGTPPRLWGVHVQDENRRAAYNPALLSSLPPTP